MSPPGLVTLSCRTVKVPSGHCCPACSPLPGPGAQWREGLRWLCWHPCRAGAAELAERDQTSAATGNGSCVPRPHVGLDALWVWPLLGHCPSPDLGLGLVPARLRHGGLGSAPAEVMGLGMRRAGRGAEGKGLLADGDALVSRPREVFPLLQRAHGPSVRLPERQRLHRLVQDPHPLHRHTGRGCGHRQG